MPHATKRKPAHHRREETSIDAQNTEQIRRKLPPVPKECCQNWASIRQKGRLQRPFPAYSVSPIIIHQVPFNPVLAWVQRSQRRSLGANGFRSTRAVLLTGSQRRSRRNAQRIWKYLIASFNSEAGNIYPRSWVDSLYTSRHTANQCCRALGGRKGHRYTRHAILNAYKFSGHAGTSCLSATAWLPSGLRVLRGGAKIWPSSRTTCPFVWTYLLGHG